MRGLEVQGLGCPNSGGNVGDFGLVGALKLLHWQVHQPKVNKGKFWQPWLRAVCMPNAKAKPVKRTSSYEA